MIGKKAQQNNKSGSWPSPPSSTARRPSSGPLADQANPIAIIPGTPTSTESFKSAISTPAPTDPNTPTGARSVKSIVTVSDNAQSSSSKEAEKDGVSGALDGDAVANADEDEPVLPMTPKSPDPRSPAIALTSIAKEGSSVTPQRPMSEDMAAVDELLGAMKQMLGTLGATFDTLGEQTMKVATLPAAIDAVNQISSVRRQLDDQHKRQEQRMQDMKTLLLEEVRSKLYSRLRETASGIVRDIIQKEIAERVRQQMHEQIPQKLRDDVLSYKRQIMEVRVSLHNSEARRHNALIRSNSLDEPLRPLLRSPPVPRSEWPLSVSIPATSGEAGSASAYTDKAPQVLPITSRVLSESDAAPANTVAHGFGRGRGKLPRLEIEPPTPSPLFPRDLTSLIRLGPEEARALVRDYGLVRVRYPKQTPKVLPVPEENALGITTDDNEANEHASQPHLTQEEAIAEPIVEEESREESLNRFLSYIGVGFQLVPTSPIKGKFGATSPASLTRVH